MAVGGNGLSARSSDEIGRLAVNAALQPVGWDSAERHPLLAPPRLAPRCKGAGCAVGAVVGAGVGWMGGGWDGFGYREAGVFVGGRGLEEGRGVERGWRVKNVEEYVDHGGEGSSGRFGGGGGRGKKKAAKIKEAKSLTDKRGRKGGEMNSNMNQKKLLESRYLAGKSRREMEEYEVFILLMSADEYTTKTMFVYLCGGGGVGVLLGAEDIHQNKKTGNSAGSVGAGWRQNIRCQIRRSKRVCACARE